MYLKVCPSIYTGPLFGAGALVFSVLPYALAHADDDGMVSLNPSALSAILGIEDETDIEWAIRMLEGQFLTKRGATRYEVIDFEKYQPMASGEERKKEKCTKERKRETCFKERTKTLDFSLPSVVSLPSKFQTPRMLKAWSEWMVHRREFRKPKSWERLFSRQVEFLSQFNEQQAFDSITQSLVSGYQGLFPPRYKNHQPVRQHGNL